MDMQTPNMADENLKKLMDLFPNIVTETIDEEGNVVRAIDKDKLEQEISTKVIEGKAERYEFVWPEKKLSVLKANAPTTNTLRPCVEESVNFDTTKNLYIEGDNLEVLKILQETYLGKAKMIYIDPPYNTGTDLLYFNKYEMNEDEFMILNGNVDEDGNFLKYNSLNDGRFHTDWINMMYPRLKLARNLLSDDGCIALAIDHNELSNLIKICDEIFGEVNRLGIITVIHKPEGRNQEKYFATSNEFALFYAKNKNNFQLEPVILDEIKIKEYEHEDTKGRYKLVNYISKNHGRAGYDKNLRENNPKKFYSIYVSPDEKEVTLEYKEGYIEALPITKTQERTWKHIKESFEEKLNAGEIVGKIENGEAKIFEKYRMNKGQLIKTHWDDKRYNAAVYGTKYLDKLMESKTFDFPKSIYLIEDIVRMTTKEESLIIDIFSGSATTANAVLNVNLKFNSKRKFILVQLPQETEDDSAAFNSGYKNICEIGKERIRRAGAKIKEDFKDQEGIEDLDIGFRVLKVDSSNMEDVYYNPLELQQDMLSSMHENIKKDRTDLDLLFQVMLDLGIEISSKIDEFSVDGKRCYSVEDDFLIACFDKNIDTDLVKEIARKKPYYAVITDRSMHDDSLLTNFEQIFKEISPDTVRRVL